MKICEICRTKSNGVTCPSCHSGKLIDFFLPLERAVDMCKRNTKHSGDIFKKLKDRNMVKDINELELILTRMHLTVKETNRCCLYRSIINPKKKIDVAVIIENNQFYSGGRYFGYQIIKALAEFIPNLVVYTNMEPIFTEDFIDYKPHKTIYVKDIRQVEVKADLYISFPVWGNVRAIELAKKYKSKCLAFIYDPLNLIKKHVPKDYKMEQKYFSPMIESLKDKDIDIVAISDYTVQGTKEWLKRKNVYKITPVINSKVLSKIQGKEKQNWICTVSRVVDRKNYIDVLKAFKPYSNDYRLKFITSTPGDIKRKIRQMGLEDKIDFILAPSDKEKFEIMVQCKAMICSSMFEGWGMWLTEALACGIPCACYKYPTFEEIANCSKMVFMADYGKVKSLEKKLGEALKYNKNKKDTTYYFDKIVKDMKKLWQITK